jgi:hypothetical protein
MEGHAFIYHHKSGEPMVVQTGWSYPKESEIPMHLLDVIEIKNV